MDTKISANIRKYPNPYSKGWFGKRGASIPRIAVGRSVIIPDKVLFIEGLKNYTLKGVLLSNFSIFVPKKV